MIAHRPTRRGRRRPGYIAVKVALCLTVIVGIVAINLDGGRLMDQRRQAQTAADAAALAAAASLYSMYWTDGGTDSTGAARTLAFESAATNGYAAATVTVNIPPLSGTFAGKVGYVEVIIETSLDATFGQLFTGSSLSATARAVARGQPMAIGMILLKSSGASAFVNSALAFALVNNPLIVNSTDPGAYDQASGGVVTAGQIDVSGGIVNPLGAVLAAPTYTGVTPTLDPLGFLPVPTSNSVQSVSPLTINTAVPVVLQPGVYEGGIHITGLSTVVMTPGVYIIQGGGFKVDSAATVTGLDVMIYNTSGSTYAAGPLSIGGLGKVVLTAPVTGTYQGISIFQDRAVTQSISITGVGLSTITGAVYAAQAQANLTGGAALGLDILGGAYVVNSMTAGGVGAVTVNLGLNPPRVPDVRIVE